MKKIIKLLSLTLLSITLFNCGDDYNNYEEDLESGWLEFKTDQSVQATTEVKIPLLVNVPIYKNGINLTYTITAVQGDYTEYYKGSTENKVLITPVIDENGSTSLQPSLYLTLENLDGERLEPVIFDVTLTTVDELGITVGLPGDNNILVHTVTIPCTNPAELPADYMIGTYLLETISDELGGVASPQEVTITGNTFQPNNRFFDYIFGGIATGATLTFDETSISMDSALPYSCDGATLIMLGDAGTDNALWDVCNDQELIINYTEDSTATCGFIPTGTIGSFKLTKVN